jgi:hypothetical protein
LQKEERVGADLGGKTFFKEDENNRRLIRMLHTHAYVINA